MSALTVPYPFDGGFVITDAYRWLESQGCKVSPGLGRIVATIIGKTFYGIHNAPLPKKLSSIQWDSERFITIAISKSLSSFDSDQLTRLVVLCHDACIRVEINPHTFRHIELVFHPRSGREGGMSDRHPTIETAVATIRNGRVQQ